MTSLIERFDQLDLSSGLLKSLEEIGYETPSPIQAACIPPLLEGRDLLGQAQTGTGKTAAFALPLLENLDLKLAKPQVLVLTPTRELAIQVAEAFQSYARHLPGFHVLPIYGGQSIFLQLRPLQRGVHVVIGTPGRVMDHIERKSLVLDELRTLVLDEADEMLRMGFIDDVEWILEHTPSTRQTALFSATMPEPIKRVAHKHLRDPLEVKIKSSTTTVEAIRQRYWQVSGLHKLDALTRILEVENDFEAAIIFVRTKTATVELAEKLEARGYGAAALHGDMTQPLRERVIEQLKSGSLDIVVATDVAARGIDVARISHVINYDIPYDTESYVHRIGRTGRAGRTGNAILFVAPREMRMLKAIEQATKQKIELLTLPTQEAVANRRIAQFKQQILDVINTEGLEFFGDVIAQIEQEQNIGAHEIAAALAYMVQQDRPLQLPQTAPQKVAKQHEPIDAESKKPMNKQRDARGFSQVKMVQYRLEVGRNHEATPKDIVGAIANEAGIESRYIGRIALFDDYSTVELPDGMPKEIFMLLKKVRVRQVPLNISQAGDQERPMREERHSKPRSDRRDFDKKPKKFDEKTKKKK